ncbi:hypothetical protein EZS27_013956 [termite gut metagenome]|uniref:Uncharacterized protein n=1 Tax=termite gut metagenome TaxID=433724 RepID=A0A5J4RY96_9ZZZZ
MKEKESDSGKYIRIGTALYKLIQVAIYNFSILSKVYPQIKAMSLIRNPFSVTA